jgi:hypothetical protein
VYPVRYYVCSRDCGWTGLLFARSELNQRKRHLLRVVIVLFFALCGIAVARHMISSAGTSSEESADE